MGGTYQSGAFTPAMVSLRLQGLWGSLVQGSVAIANPPNQGSFQLDNDFMSYLVGGPFTVKTFNGTDFLNLNGLSQLANAGSTHVVAVGLVFNNGQNLPVADVGVVAVRP
ncbi:MAG: hypothetical protein JO266_08065 [Acidobacteria bacterium]|nr:hypothetical protein [Acidobacteriota bacterium]